MIENASQEIQDDLIRRHIQALARKYWHLCPVFTTIVEGNMCWITANGMTALIDEVLSIYNVPNVRGGCSLEHIGRPGPNNTTVRGVRTTEDNKVSMTATINTLLNRDSVLYDPELVCIGARNGLKHQTDRVSSIVILLREQLTYMREFMTPKGHRVISGKMGGKNDDLAICMGIGVIHALALEGGACTLAP